MNFKNQHRSSPSLLKSGLGMAVLLAALFAGSHAMAATLPAVPASRMMEPQAPSGLIVALGKADGLMTMTIDDQRSDWDQAIVYDGDLRAVEVMAVIAPPSSAAGFVAEGGLPFASDDEAIAFFDDNESNPYFQPTPLQFMDCTAPQMVAQYVAEKKIVSPISSDNTYIYVRWYDSQNAPILTEKARVEIKHTQPESRYASPRMVLSEDIVANADTLAYLTSSKQGGEIVYTFTDAQAVGNPASYILTKIKAPAGAVCCDQVDVMRGNMPLSVVNGYVELQSTYMEQRFVQDANGIWQRVPALKTGTWRENYALEWEDANGNVVDYSMVVIYVNMLEREPWPCYATTTGGIAWSAVPDSRLHIQKGAALSDVTTAYQSSDGILRFGYQNVLPSAKGMDEATVAVTITPPAGAAKYTQFGAGGSGQLGRLSRENSVYMQLMSTAKKAITGGSVLAWDYPIFEKIDAPDGKVSIYLSTVPSDPDECQIYAFCWFDSSDQPIAIEYYSVLSDSFVSTTKTEACESEADVPVIDRYGVVVKADDEWWDCMLVTSQYPQSGDSLYYELRLEDHMGSVIKLDKPVVLYLPYPYGHAYGEKDVVYQLQHYDLDFKRFTTIPLTQTPKGLRCETGSFSPFVMSWEDAPEPVVPPIEPPIEPPATPPKTGDNAAPALWAALLAVALMGMGVIGLGCRKKKKA